MMGKTFGSGSGSGSESVDGGQLPLPAIKTPRMAVSLALKLTEIIAQNGARKVIGYLLWCSATRSGS